MGLNDKPKQENKDKEYADWCLMNNWHRLDNAAYFYVCGEMPDDEQYAEWAERTLTN